MTLDYSRWNRGGLERLQYIDGNAPTYLDDIRQRLRIQFAGDPDVLRWLTDHDDAESLAEWQQRLLAQYHSPRRDYGWETLRTLSRALHVLARYADAYANERYIGTATQWDNLRRLVAMLDYQPALPASAETWLAFIADEEDQAIGEVTAGLAVVHEPDDGGEPVVFETLTDLDVDYRLNQLQAPAPDQSSDNWDWHGGGVNSLRSFLWASQPAAAKVGDWGVLAEASHARAVTVAQVKSDRLELLLQSSSDESLSWSIADTRLLRRPKWQQAPELNGPDVLDFGNAALTAQVGDVLLHKSGSSYTPARVLSVKGGRVRLNKAASAGDYYLVQVSRAQTINGSSRALLPLERGHNRVWNQNLGLISTGNVNKQAVEDGDGDLYEYVNASTSAQVYYLPTGSNALSANLVEANNRLSFAGKAGDLGSGQWVIVQGSGGTVVVRIASVQEEDGLFSLSLPDLDMSQSWTYARGLFQESLALAGYDRNEAPLFINSSASHSEVELALVEVPGILKPGRKLWFESSHDAVLAQLAEIVSAGNGVVRLRVTPGLEGRNLPKWETRVYGNVVLAGHGERQDEKVLGSGDRIQANQSFAFHQKTLSFVQDTQFSKGVRAAVEVRVDARTWTQVETLRNSGPTDTHYVISMTEDDEAKILFGDGQNGQRLPTGTDNVRIAYRKGRGLAGNLPAHNLNELKKPHPLIKAVIQPVASAGGGETEGIDSLRTQAPKSVLTLGRAVALKDYGHLAQAHSGVWQASAFALPDSPGLADRVEVVVVSAGGGELGPLQANLKTLLRQHSPPGVQVLVSRYEPVLMGLDVWVRVEVDAFDPDQVAEWVKDTLYDQLSLQRRLLGQPIYRSTVTDILERVTGVRTSHCGIATDFQNDQGVEVSLRSLFVADDGSVRRASPTLRQVLYLDAGQRPINLTVEEV
ncbi:MAG: baseplate J/gp47 family protein [Saccharospirillum sp.]|nr:baseplate J/gp47 family protein [Saccharospirillum sp.]